MIDTSAQSRFPKVSIIVLNWNGREETLSCLQSISELDYPNYDIILIDNGSLTDDRELFIGHNDRVRYFRQEHNLGYTGGNNLGMKIARSNGSDFFWLLNNDAKVEADCLTKMVEFGSRFPEFGLLSPMIVDVKGESRGYLGTILDFENKQRRVLIGYPDRLHDSTRIHLWGTALLVSRKLVEVVGELDERFFAYYEDYDFSERSLRAGFRNQVIVDARAYHPLKKVPSQRAHPLFQFYNARNEFLFWSKYLSSDEYKAFQRKLISKYLIRSQNLILAESEETARACLEGVYAALKRRYGDWTYRKRLPLSVVRILTAHPYLLSMVLFGRKFPRESG